MPQKESTILIVDDDRLVIEQLMRHFRRRDCTPIATADSRVVEETLRVFNVQLMLLDLRMERLDGYAVLENLRKKQLEIPVLVITAYYEDEKTRLQSFGITEEDVIKKPFGDFSETEEIINRKLRRIIFPAEVGSEYEDRIYRKNRAHVMVVDDEKEIAEILATTLKGLRYSVSIFGDGAAALQYFKTHPNEIHMAVIDMAIPRLLGHELIREMIAIDPDVKIIPISARYEEEMKEKLASVGFDPNALVTKPFKLEVLIEQLKVFAAGKGLI